MLMNSSMMMFLMMMTTSTLMVYSSSSFSMSWMSMEMNMIMFLPMITKSKKMKDQSMKYFIIQNLSSSILLLSMIMNLKIETPINFEKLMMISLMMKMGMIPFHLWLISFMEKLSWMNCFFMNSIQKISPILIIPQMINFKYTLMPMIFSLLIAPIAMLKLNSLKKIMAYSSIYNSPWMISSIFLSKKLFIMFFIIYSLMNFTFMKKMENQNSLFLNQITEKNSLNKLNFVINMISISGMPPTLGFMPKWMILIKMNEVSFMISIAMLFSSFISTFIYLKVVSSMLMNQTTKKKFFKMKKMYELEITINILGLLNFIMLKPS
uniref:NADH dehydrogenase subunit 2 n=1 Tax=Pseudosymplanella nigrifasciata TaxID=2886261 RepID=UPI001E7FB882|nr:NADH dehydrogenase subunit 2 [Pseudosymplanella nigrifasciata]UDL72058.1 NADH dehydrogenase subunit 2 [Pseudosymplanella nigrifasciata]